MSVFKTDWCPRTATFQLSNTASPGFEPELEESKSPVLPLDHKAISHRSEGNRTPICGSKVHHDRHYTTLPNCHDTGNERIRTSATRDTISHAAATTHSRITAVASFICSAGVKGIEPSFAERQSAVVTTGPHSRFVARLYVQGRVGLEPTMISDLQSDAFAAPPPARCCLPILLARHGNGRI